MRNEQCPYSDDFMRYDEITGCYVLTEKDLVENLGLDIRARISADATVNPEAVINRLLERASNLIYGYIYEHNADNCRQNLIIATVPRAREIIRRAMENQVNYMCVQGDLSLSVKPEERALSIDQSAKTLLNTTIPEIGGSLLYAGY